MQALANKCNVKVKPFSQGKQAPCRVCTVQCRAQQQQSSNAQQVAAAVLAASVLVAPAAHAATEVLQSMDVSMAVGGGAAVAGLGALLVATDPQKRLAEPAGLIRETTDHVIAVCHIIVVQQHT